MSKILWMCSEHLVVDCVKCSALAVVAQPCPSCARLIHERTVLADAVTRLKRENAALREKLPPTRDEMESLVPPENRKPR